MVQRHEAARRALEDEERSLAEQGRLPAEGVVATLRGDLAALEAPAQRDEGDAGAPRACVAESPLAEAAAAARVEAVEAAVAGLGDPEARRGAAGLEGVLGPVA